MKINLIIPPLKTKMVFLGFFSCCVIIRIIIIFQVFFQYGYYTENINGIIFVFLFLTFLSRVYLKSLYVIHIFDIF